MTTIEQAMQFCPLVAILRGITPAEVLSVGEVLYDSGFRCIEVPLNSPNPYASIKSLTNGIPSDCITGAGTVLKPDQVLKVRDAGGRVIVSPNFSDDVVRTTIEEGMISLPGVGTPTEAFNAIDAGARWLKIFPAATYGTSHVAALNSVLPTDVKLVVTGGVSAHSVPDWRKAGAVGFGIGSELYRAGDTVESVRRRAMALVEAIDGRRCAGD